MVVFGHYDWLLVTIFSKVFQFSWPNESRYLLHFFTRDNKPIERFFYFFFKSLGQKMLVLEMLIAKMLILC